jgi:hypothetical protein
MKGSNPGILFSRSLPCPRHRNPNSTLSTFKFQAYASEHKHHAFQRSFHIYWFVCASRPDPILAGGMRHSSKRSFQGVDKQQFQNNLCVMFHVNSGHSQDFITFSSTCITPRIILSDLNAPAVYFESERQGCFHVNPSRWVDSHRQAPRPQNLRELHKHEDYRSLPSLHAACLLL